MIVATTFILNKNLIISAERSAILFESSWMVIVSGIFTSLITFTVSFFSSGLSTFFSFSLARLTDAKLLCFISTSSTFIARETVSLNSRLDDKGSFNFNLVLEGFFSSFLIKFFVACCSTNFLTKLLLNASGFLKPPAVLLGLLSRDDLKGVFFSIEKVFFPSLDKDDRSIFFDMPVDIVKVFFLFF